MESIFQSHEWEEFKLKTGYQKGFWVDNILVLKKELPLGWSMLYTPMARSPQLQIVDHQSFLSKIKSIARDNKAIFYRLEFDVKKEELDTGHWTLGTGFVKSFEEMQPEHTLVLDLTTSEEELLAQMKQKGRYNIKIAEKNNIEIKISNKPGKELDDFYEMYSATAKRHGITHRTKKYFEALLEILGENGYARVYTAYGQNIESGILNIGENNRDVPLASAIMVYSGKRAIYMFGSSSDEFKNMMAPYTLHWRMIRDAKNDGYLEYDFFGIAPDESPKHPWAGVTRFKKQFGGHQVDILGSFDLVLNPLMYRIFKIAEKIRRH